MEHLERARLPATRHRAPCAPQPAAAQPERTPARSSDILAAPQLTTLATWGGLQARGSRLHYVRTVRLVGTTPSSWAGLHRLWAPGRATHSGRAARPRRARWEAAVRPWAPDNVADFVAFHPQVLGFVYNSTLSLRLRRKRNTSILVTV